MWVHFDPGKKKNPLRSDSEWVRGGDSRSIVRVYLKQQLPQNPSKSIR